MNAPAKPVFATVGFKNKKPPPNVDAIIKESNALAAEDGIITILSSETAPAPEASAAAPEAATPMTTTRTKSKMAPRKARRPVVTDTPPAMRRLTAELPAYVVQELFDRAHDLTRDAGHGTVTVRFLLLKALEKDGYHVDPEDLMEDRRRDV